MKTNGLVKNECIVCEQETWHEVLGCYKRDLEPIELDYGFTEHMLVQCRGCERVSYREVFHDTSSAFPNDNDEWEIPTSTLTYPKRDIGGINSFMLPTIVASIYNETCNAYRDGSMTLAGIGFRATIEAICNDQEISGKELSTRINNLATKGLISKKDSKRLHSIRFMGNDAAHDIKKPSQDSLEAAKIITEHLLTTVTYSTIAQKVN